MTVKDEKAIDRAIKLQIGLTMSMIARTGKAPEDRRELNSHGITAHQRVLLGLLLRQRGKKFTLAEAACFYHATVISLLNRGLVEFEDVGGVLHLTTTEEGHLASNRSLPVEVVLREMGPRGGKAAARK